MTRTSVPLIVGAFQFAGSGDVGRNAAAIERGICQAARRGVRLLVTQECALTGYAGVDIDSPGDIDRGALAAATRRLAAMAGQYRMHVALGTTTFHRGRARNSLCLIGPDGLGGRAYHKRAQFGDDALHYVPGVSAGGVRNVDGVRVGLRICFEFRFPEYFRELLAGRADLAAMAFSMVGPDVWKFDVARAHLMARAAENGLYVLAANSISRRQNAPTCLVSPDGRVLAQAPRGREALIVGLVERHEATPLRASIVAHARGLTRGPRQRGR
ncbi:MAG: carbon-nitrogen hydrolase family protein [Planctomycetota bacterium]|jgi:predicted amidohydrolase